MHCKQMRAKKGNEPESVLSLTVLWVPVSDGPDPLAVAAARPWVRKCPHFDPDSLVAEHNASNGTSQQRRGFHPTFHMHCKQMRAKKGNDPQRVELVPHGALSARLRWTRFLLQSLQRPLGYTECPHFNPDSPVAEHNASNVPNQQRRGFHPTCHMHCKQRRAKKGNEPPKGRTCPSRCSECPSPMDPIPLAMPAAPLGVHRMTSLQPRLPSGRAQRFKCHQSSAQRFSPSLPHALQANESKKKQ